MEIQGYALHVPATGEYVEVETTWQHTAYATAQEHANDVAHAVTVSAIRADGVRVPECTMLPMMPACFDPMTTRCQACAFTGQGC